MISYNNNNINALPARQSSNCCDDKVYSDPPNTFQAPDQMHDEADIRAYSGFRVHRVAETPDALNERIN